MEPVPVEDYEELCIAVVMNGGVSLAVWMGGVTHEIDRLRRRQGAYGDVLDLLQVEPRVDVISGSSAGGINGALLATAVAHDATLINMRDLWVQISVTAAARAFRPGPYLRSSG